MKISYKRILFSTFLSLLCLSQNIDATERIEKLSSLVFDNNTALKSIRDDVKTEVYTIRSRRSEKCLPELKFYTYTVKEKENFWVVMSKCSLDMDTLMTVNNLTSPYQVKPGTTLYIPNMRGVIMSGSDKAILKKMLIYERIDEHYVMKINRTSTLDKKFLFIPCGRVSGLEKSLFMGTAFVCPLTGGRATSAFGSRRDPFNSHRMEFHKGVDMGCASGTQVHASRSGVVAFAGYQEGYGNLIIIQHEFGYQSYYGHLSRCNVKPGMQVVQGQAIGLSGSTGRSTGPHLHFEIRKNGHSLNPGAFIRTGA